MKSKSDPKKIALIILLPLLLIVIAAYGSWQNKSVRGDFFIFLLDSPKGGRAARELRKYPGEKTRKALIKFINDDKHNWEDQASAVASLCLITGQTFGTDIEGNAQNYSIGNMDAKHLPDIKAKVNEWAVDNGYSSIAKKVAKNEELEALLESLADSNGKRAAKAWTKIPTKYNDAQTFLDATRLKLWDPRPINFRIIEAFEDQTQYYKAEAASTKQDAGLKVMPARTVGESLRFQLYNLADASQQYPGQDFFDWWNDFHRRNDLLYAAKVWTDSEKN